MRSSLRCAVRTSLFSPRITFSRRALALIASLAHHDEARSTALAARAVAEAPFLAGDGTKHVGAEHVVAARRAFEW